MKIIVKYSYFILCFIFLLYLVPNGPQFPSFPADVIISNEPGDTADPNIKAFFTDLDREEVMNYYTDNLKSKWLGSFSYPTYRLNYPPENAQIIIQDQLRSSFLEEVVHPFRESLYINGFTPTSEKDSIFIEGRKFKQKITLKYVPSNSIFRVIIGFIVVGIPPILYIYWRQELMYLMDILPKLIRKK